MTRTSTTTAAATVTKTVATQISTTTAAATTSTAAAAVTESEEAKTVTTQITTSQGSSKNWSSSVEHETERNGTGPDDMKMNFCQTNRQDSWDISRQHLLQDKAAYHGTLAGGRR